jgi:hypothetical protein
MVAGILLSACGDRFAAPAAVVDGSKISTDTLKQELDLLLLDPQLKQQVAGSSGEANRKDLTRRLLAFLIELRVIEGYARANGISVTPAEVDLALQQTIQGLGGRTQFQQELKARGLTFGAVRRNIERQILFRKVEDRLAARAGLSAAATQEEKDRAFQDWFSQQLSTGDIDVNPRFGRLDPKTGQIVPISSTAT